MHEQGNGSCGPLMERGQTWAKDDAGRDSSTFASVWYGHEGCPMDRGEM
jgi:hypothetical protein